MKSLSQGFCSVSVFFILLASYLPSFGKAQSTISIKQISGVSGALCALSENGRVECWGDLHRLGSVPESLPKASSISVSQSYAVVATEQGVRAWGDPCGMLQYTCSGNLPIPTGIKNVKKVLAGDHVICGLSDIAIDCWSYAYGGTAEKISVSIGDHWQFNGRFTDFAIAGEEGGVCAFQNSGSLICLKRNGLVIDEAGLPSFKTGRSLSPLNFAMDGPFRGFESYGLCGRDNEGLKCWASPSYSGERVGYRDEFGGVLKYRDVGAVKALELPSYIHLGQIKEIVASRGDYCVNSDKGVFCEDWSTNHQWQQISGFKNPRQLQALASGGMTTVCAITDEGVVCRGADDLENVPLDLIRQVAPPTQSEFPHAMFCRETDIPTSECTNYTGAWKGRIVAARKMMIKQNGCEQITSIDINNGLGKVETPLKLNGKPVFSHYFRGKPVFVAACSTGNDLYVEKIYGSGGTLFQINESELCYRNYENGSDSNGNCEFIEKVGEP